MCWRDSKDLLFFVEEGREERIYSAQVGGIKKERLFQYVPLRGRKEVTSDYISAELDGGGGRRGSSNVWRGSPAVCRRGDAKPEKGGEAPRKRCPRRKVTILHHDKNTFQGVFCL